MRLFLTFVLAALVSAAASAETGGAKVQATAAGSAVSGTVAFADTKEGLKITVNLSGVPAGEHGFHIHEFGACDDAGKAAGGHYNPKAAPHGHVLKTPKMAHAGDMGNVTAGADGKVVVELVLPKLVLTGGRHSVAGRAVILHEKVDDFSQPAGNAGGRIGCGVIIISGK